MTSRDAKKRTPKRVGRAPLWRAGIALALVAMAGAAVYVAPRAPSRLPAELRLPLPPSPPPREASVAPPSLAPTSPPAGAMPSAPPAIPPREPPRAAQPLPAPWQRYAATAPAADGRPWVAIVIDDLGLDRKRSLRTVALPGPLTLAWLPYAHDVTQQAAAARRQGHEILLHLPMQPQGKENPGPNALTVDLSAEEIRRRVASGLALLPEAVGLNNHMGSRFTRDAGAMAPVAAELKERGQLFLDSRTALNSIAGEVARTAGVPTALRDVFLDNEPIPVAVAERLAETEAIARRRGHAIAIGHPHDVTLDALEPWLRGLAARGLVLAPVSAIVKRDRERLASAHAATTR